MTEKAPKDAAMITVATVEGKLGDIQVMVNDLGSKARYWKAMAKTAKKQLDKEPTSTYDRTWRQLSKEREDRIAELETREVDLMAANKHLDTRLGLKTKLTEEQECRIEDQLSAINVLDLERERLQSNFEERCDTVKRMGATILEQKAEIRGTQESFDELLEERNELLRAKAPSLDAVEENAFQFAVQGHEGTYVGYDERGESVKMCARCMNPWECACSCHELGWSKAQYFDDQGSWVQVRGDEIWCAPALNDGSCEHENWVEACSVGEPEDSALIEVAHQIANAEGLSIRFLHNLPAR